SYLRSRIRVAILAWSPRASVEMLNPEGVACVMGTEVTQPTALPASLNFCKMGVYTSPFGPVLMAPLFTLWPPPQEELAAEESVTIEFRDAMSISARRALPSRYRPSQFEPRPSLRKRSWSAMARVPLLIPSLTMKMMFLAPPGFFIST